MAEWIMQVAELNRYVEELIHSDTMLRQVRIRGEIGTFKRQVDGAWYFTLKDEEASIDAVMWRQNAARMSLQPETGMRVIVSGYVGLYVKTGRYQFYANAIRPDGQGSLYQRFLALRDQLTAEGVIDETRKRPLPLRPRRVAVITAETGAVLHDIRKVSAMRDPSIPLVLVPARVQGVGAAQTMIAALSKAAALDGVGVIIIGRGGGSMEDLWCFNDEALARAISRCPIPVVSAVGHETDFTIADFVADVRASTPSNAAEIVIPSRDALLNDLNRMERLLRQRAEQSLQHQQVRLMRFRQRLIALQPAVQIEKQQTRLHLFRLRLMRQAERKLNTLQPLPDLYRGRLQAAMQHRLEQSKVSINLLAVRLASADPNRPLQHGYALVMDGRRVLTSAKDAAQVNHYQLVFHDGQISVNREDAYAREEKTKL